MEEKNNNNSTTQQLSHLKVALVHDFLNQYGGAERVLKILTEIFPQAPIYTLIYDKEKMKSEFTDKKIYTSFFGKWPRFLQKRFKWFLPLLVVAPETFDLRNYDLVISSSSAWSKGIITRLNTVHFAYIHSPMRFVWDYNEKYLREERKEKLGFLVRPVLSYFRLWDRLAADRPEYLIANSKYTQKRIKKYYNRESEVIYPPVSFKSKILNSKSQINSKLEIKKLKFKDNKYFLMVSRLSAYKKVDLAVKTFNKLGLPLIVVGEGKQKECLKNIAKENIKFMGWVEDEKLVELYQNARALIFPGVDDFGLVLAEVQTRGVPAIAFRQGGALEIVEEGLSGEFFEEQTIESLEKAVKKFIDEEKEYDKNYIKEKSERFSRERFKKEIIEYITDNI